MRNRRGGGFAGRPATTASSCESPRSRRSRYCVRDRLPPSRFVFLREGRTVTRRPNNLASTEYAPGPSSASATASHMWKTFMMFPELKPISKFATADTSATTDRYGVKKPMLSDIDTNRIAATSKWIEGTRELVAVFIALITKTAATEILRSNNARPGPP